MKVDMNVGSTAFMNHQRFFRASLTEGRKAIFTITMNNEDRIVGFETLVTKNNKVLSTRRIKGNDEISGRDIIKILDKLQKIAKKDVNLFKEFIDTVKGK